MKPTETKKNIFSDLSEKTEKKSIAKEINKIQKKKLRDLEFETYVKKIELVMKNKVLLATQIKLEKTVENFSEIFNHAPIGYFILDNNGIIMNVNIKGCKLLGIDGKQLIGKPFSVFLHGESCQDDFYRHRNVVMDNNKLNKIETEILKKDGSICSVILGGNVVNDENGNFKYHLTTICDFTKSKEDAKKVELALVKEKELSEMKSRFISMASHEFRTPLCTILMSASLIDSYDKTEDSLKRKQHTKKIVSSVNGLKEILSEFLSMSKIENNLICNHPETFNLIKFTEDTIAGSITENRIINYKDLGECQDVYLDSKLLKVCLTSIINNAVKFSSNASKIEITTKKNTNGNIKISIKDHGIGIPEEDKARIFEPFFRAENTDTIHGIGLGLNIVKKIIEVMGGTITFESKINEGSVFILNFSGKKKQYE